MIDMYTKLVEVGKRTIESVPTKYRAAVTEQLQAMGLNEKGEVIV